jgi:hypothetical protein
MAWWPHPSLRVRQRWSGKTEQGALQLPQDLASQLVELFMEEGTSVYLESYLWIFFLEENGYKA